MGTSTRPQDQQPASSELSRSDNPAINADPPAASGTPLQGQHETNPPQTGDRELPSPATNDPAYEFGWQSYMQHGRTASSTSPTFESLEPDLKKAWEERQQSAANRKPWEEARAMARDAWMQVQSAMSGQ